MTLGVTYGGLRVLDLSTNLAGPFAAMILGDMGADVVKIERPPIGDETRALPPHWNGDSTVFLSVNRNKRSLVLDLKDQKARAAILRLVERADVVVESFPPGLAEKLQLTFEILRARNPRVLLCSISAFGDGAIGSKLPGYDALAQAVSGMMSFTGHPNTSPVRLAPSVLDLSTGMWAAMGIMAALARRASGGSAEHIRPALIDSAFALMGHQVLGFMATGDMPRKLGSGAPSAAPYRVFEASDGQLMLATASDAQFERLCRAMGMDELVCDQRFRTMAGRLGARDELDAILAEKISHSTVAFWLDHLGSAGLSVGRVNDIKQALEAPLTAERDLFAAPDAHGLSDDMPLLRLPIDPLKSGVRLPPPKLGQHSAEVLKEHGFSAEEIVELLSHRT